ncbi:hypothetical protein EXIGLDRAFT_735706, partial [Exidia glandulosa HHB12029]
MSTSFELCRLGVPRCAAPVLCMGAPRHGVLSPWVTSTSCSAGRSADRIVRLSCSPPSFSAIVVPFWVVDALYLAGTCALQSCAPACVARSAHGRAARAVTASLRSLLSLCPPLAPRFCRGAHAARSPRCSRRWVQQHVHVSIYIPSAQPG